MQPECKETVDNLWLQPDTGPLVSESESSMSHAASLSSAEKARASRRENARRYRQHRRDAGVADVLFQLPGSVIAVIDAIKERHGLRNRSEALLQLIEERGDGAQQKTT